METSPSVQYDRGGWQTRHGWGIGRKSSSSCLWHPHVHARQPLLLSRSSECRTSGACSVDQVHEHAATRAFLSPPAPAPRTSALAASRPSSTYPAPGTRPLSPTTNKGTLAQKNGCRIFFQGSVEGEASRGRPQGGMFNLQTSNLKPCTLHPKP